LGSPWAANAGPRSGCDCPEQSSFTRDPMGPVLPFAPSDNAGIRSQVVALRGSDSGRGHLLALVCQEPPASVSTAELNEVAPCIVNPGSRVFGIETGSNQPP